MSTARQGMGLFAATGIGIGAIVGGGILALAGTAFAVAGPGAILAFAGNAVIALLTAATFAALAARFPESGGTYTFARRVLSVEAAFVVGWVVWFASIVAGVLYAIGFGAFAGEVIATIWNEVSGDAPAWINERTGHVLLALVALIGYLFQLERGGGGGGAIGNIIKLVLFTLLIGAGIVWCVGLEAGALDRRMTPFLPGGMSSIAIAMGFTFIAFQGFDLVAAASGEVRDARKTVPRAIFLSLGLAMAIYLPLMFITALTLGGGEEDIRAVAEAHPETVIAISTEVTLGPIGWWFVMVAAVFAMASALQANLFAASRIATAMAGDRTLPHMFERPSISLRTTAFLIAILILALPDVAAAGAAASLIFLVTFALAHGILFLARRRVGLVPGTYRTPFFPTVPVLGGLACVSLAIFQGVTVPAAGMIGAAWVVAGACLFIGRLSTRARARDAASESRDPDLVRLRGRAPLVLAPIANPANAVPMLTIADALAPPGPGRVLLLSVVRRSEGGSPEDVERRIEVAQSVVRRVLGVAHDEGIRHETMLTVANDQWSEIERVARLHRCAALVVGLSAITDSINEGPLLGLLRGLECDAVILRTPPEWSAVTAKRVVVPLAGRAVHDVVRARLVAGLVRSGVEEVVYIRVMPPDAPPNREARLTTVTQRTARDEAGARGRVEIIRSENVAEELVARAQNADLAILGLHQVARKRRIFGAIALQLAQETDTALAFIAEGAGS